MFAENHKLFQIVKKIFKKYTKNYPLNIFGIFENFVAFPWKKNILKLFKKLFVGIFRDEYLKKIPRLFEVFSCFYVNNVGLL